MAKKRTVSPHAAGPGAVESRRKALRPSFKDLDERATKMAEDRAAGVETSETYDPDDMPEGINMGGVNPHAPDDLKGQLVKKAAVRQQMEAFERDPDYVPPERERKQDKDFDPLDPFDHTQIAHPAEVANISAPQAKMKPCERCEFFNAEQAVTLAMETGQFSIAAIDVRETQFSIAVMVSLEDRFIFIPVPGSEMNLSYQIGSELRTRKVYFPGTHANYEELGVMVLQFVKAEPEAE